MPVSREEEWVQIAELDDDDHIRFTPAYLAIMEDLGWEAKAFAGHLIALWYDPFEHMLDYTSRQSETEDQPGEFNHNWLDQPQDVVGYWAAVWSSTANSHKPSHDAGTGLGLSPQWYRDILRAKLVSIRLPKRLILDYRRKVIDHMGAP